MYICVDVSSFVRSASQSRTTGGHIRTGGITGGMHSGHVLWYNKTLHICQSNRCIFTFSQQTHTHERHIHIHTHCMDDYDYAHKPYTYTQFRHAVDTSTVLLVAGGAVRWSVRIKHTCIMLYADTQTHAVCDIVISRYNGRKRARACVAAAAAATQNVRCARIISSDTLLSILGHREDRAGFGFCWQVHKANARASKAKSTLYTQRTNRAFWQWRLNGEWIRYLSVRSIGTGCKVSCALFEASSSAKLRARHKA